ncbi:MAG: EMC3/TMCO1 family protein [Nanoarchaeota archaeon]|nr:EMC3/TMCO1 family protein [Nanoarchaeota archaeon]
MSFLDPILNPVLLPLLNKSPILLIILFSFVLSLIITLVYKFMTNQEEIKRLKEQQKETQKRIKELRSNPEEAMKLQKEAMKPTMDMMRHSIKAMLITLVIAGFTFPWMGQHLTYEAIGPNDVYSVTATFEKGVTGDAELILDKGTVFDSSEAKQPISDREVTWRLKSTEGEHTLAVKIGEAQQQKEVLINTDFNYERPDTIYKDSNIDKITINYEKFTPLGDFTFPLSDWQPGWLAIYLISSIVFSLGLRKLLKVH